MRKFLRRARNALKYVRRGEWRELARRTRFLLSSGGDHWKPPQGPIESLSWLIVTPPHGAFVAGLLERRLRELGAQVQVTHDMPRRFVHDYYIVLAPQVFRRLPPQRSLYIYQLEQTLSSQWFTEKYLRLMESCRGLLEYKQGNFAFLAERGIAFPHVHYLPVGGNPDLYAEEPGLLPGASRNVLFYGAWKANPRRREILQALEADLAIERQDKLFASALHRHIKSGTAWPVILNIHHYDPAQLELPRLWEAVSLGALAVSEDSPDGEEDELLRQAIVCVPAGDVPGLRCALSHAVTSPADAEARKAVIEAGWKRFCFYFDRFLLAEGFIAADDARRTMQPLGLAQPAPPAQPPRWCLTLPETDPRYRNARVLPVSRCHVGLRRRPGWIGCALSYREIARLALAQGLDALWVIEDDVALLPDFEDNMAAIWQYLASRDDWDICVGHLTLVDAELQVARVERVGGTHLLYLNQFLGMAANLYRRKALEAMASWQPDAGDEYANTIDLFMKSRGLRTVATWPYLVAHDDEHQSTLWGFNNAHYQQTIEATRRQLDALCQAAESP